MEPYEYTYPEEEEQTPRRKAKPSIIIALIIGLLIGGMGGYVLGSRSTGESSLTQLSDSPYIMLIVNAIFVIAILVLAVLKGSRRVRMTDNPVHNDVRSRILSLVIAGLVMAGLIAFLVYSGKIQ